MSAKKIFYLTGSTMQMKKRCYITGWLALVAIVFGVAPDGWGQADPFRGLWVGSVSLRGVNEVSIPKDETGTDRAPNPDVPTATFDEANLRLILHVNGAGQVSLLKDVAILNRIEGAGDLGVYPNETDLSLVTDPRLYPSFPAQPARRIASATFDFGDAAATRAVEALIDESVRLATEQVIVLDRTVDLASQGLRVQAAQNIAANIVSSNNVITANANVSEAFGQFIQAFDAVQVDAIALNDALSPAVITANLVLATALKDQSFYQDVRGSNMVIAVRDSVASAGSLLADRERAAQNTAASFADVENLFQRFVSGKVFGDAILAAAEKAGELRGLTPADLRAAMRATPEAAAAILDANNAKVGSYRDTRSIDTFDIVISEMAQQAFADRALSEAQIEASSDAAGRASLADMVARYPLQRETPTLDYNEWVTSAEYAGAAQIAADAAAQAAVANLHESALSDAASVTIAARDATITALRTVLAQASRAQRSELPMIGTFAPGSGDTNIVATLTQPSDLGPAGLEGVIYLPAMHPTNPFLHFRHPDHTTGFNIERKIRLDFDGMVGDATETAAYGVDRITGTYREEIFGLHKPLGPAPDTDPVGLKTEGRFELNRISYIDTLNTR